MTDLTVLQALQHFSDVECSFGFRVGFANVPTHPKLDFPHIGKFIPQPLDYTQVIPTLLMVWLLKLKRVNTYATFVFYISITFLLISDKQHI